MQDLGSSLVGDSKNKRTRAHARRFLVAPGENRGAGSVGNREGIAEVLLSISQSVKWQEMERTVRHHNEVLPVEKRAERCDEFAVKSFQMTMRGTQERLFESPDVFAAHSKLGKLKSQQLQKMSNTGEHGHGQNVDFLAGDDRGYDSVASRKVFDKSGVRRKMGLQLCEGEIRGGLQRCIFPLVRRKFAQSSH